MNNVNRVFIHQLKSVQDNAYALAQSIQAVLIRIEGENDSQKEDDVSCNHPSSCLKSAQVMGHPNRFHCSKCNQIVTVEPEHQPQRVVAS